MKRVNAPLPLFLHEGNEHSSFLTENIKATNQLATDGLFNNWDEVECSPPSDSLMSVPLVKLRPETALGMFKERDCNVLSGSPFEVNSMFGSGTDRPYYIQKVTSFTEEFNNKVVVCITETAQAIKVPNKITYLKGKLNAPKKIDLKVSAKNKEDLRIKWTKDVEGSFQIESDIPVVIEESKGFCCGMRIIAPEVICNVVCDFGYLEIITQTCQFGESAKVCALSLIIRSNNVKLAGSISAGFCLILSSSCMFTKGKAQVDDFLISSDQLSSTSQLSGNNFCFMVKETNFRAKSGISCNTVLITSDITSTSATITATNTYFENRSLTIKGDSLIHVKHFYLLFTPKKGGDDLGKNDGIIQCETVFMDANITGGTGASNVQGAKFVQNNAMSISACLMLNSGTIRSTGNIAVRSAYIAAYGMLEIERRGSIKLGDFLAVEKLAGFRCSGLVKPYIHLLPMIFSSGKIHLESIALLKCQRFVSDGSLTGNCNIECVDLLSVSGEISCGSIMWTSGIVGITKFAKMNANDVLIKCCDCQINSSMIEGTDPEASVCRIEYAKNLTNCSTTFRNWKTCEMIQKCIV